MTLRQDPGVRPERGRVMRPATTLSELLSILPEWAGERIPILSFAPADDDESEESEDESEESEDEDSEDEETEDEDEEEEEDDDPKVRAAARKAQREELDRVRATMRKERKERQRLAKENKSLKRQLPAKDEPPKKDEDKEKDAAARAAADDKVRQEREAEQRKTERLAEKLATNAVDTAIVKLAGPLKFKDVEDALRLVNRKDIDFDQDDEDPSEVEVDEETVLDALKALAKRKPHLLDDGKQRSAVKTGSRMSGKGGTKKKTEDELRRKYSALNRP